MSVQETLQKEIGVTKMARCPKEENTYRRDLRKRIELINWVLDELKKPGIFICEVIETK